MLRLCSVWALTVIACTVILLFSNGLFLAACFFGTCWSPFVAIGALRWTLALSSVRQRIVVAVVSLVLLGIGYWLSREVTVYVYGVPILGLYFWLASAIVGFDVPRDWAGEPMVADAVENGKSVLDSATLARK